MPNKEAWYSKEYEKGYNGTFKAKVAMESIKREKTLAQRSREFGVHTNKIGQWRKQVVKELMSLFSDRRKKRDKEQDDLISELYSQIGQLNKPEAFKGGGERHVCASR